MAMYVLTGNSLCSQCAHTKLSVPRAAIDDITADLLAHPLNSTYTKVKFEPVFLQMAYQTNITKPQVNETVNSSIY